MTEDPRRTHFTHFDRLHVARPKWLDPEYDSPIPACGANFGVPTTDDWSNVDCYACTRTNVFSRAKCEAGVHHWRGYGVRAYCQNCYVYEDGARR